MDDFYIELKKAGLAERAKANLDFKEIIFCIGLTALAGFCIFEIVRVIGRQKRKEARLKACRQLYDTDAEYAIGISEVNLPETSYYKQCRLYITPDYVVSCKEGVEVFRIEDIRELYGYDKSEHSISMFLLFGMFAAYRMNHYLAAVTSDEELHIFAELSVVGKLHNEIVRKLILKNPSMTIGRNNTPAAELPADSKDFKISKVPGFYGNTEVWKGRVKEDFVV